MIQQLQSREIKTAVLKGLMKESRINRKPFVIRDFYKPMFGWDFGIDLLNKCMLNSEPNISMIKTGDYYFILQPSEKYNDVYSDYYDLINTAHPDGVISIPVILVSIFNNIPNLTEHADPLDQMHLAIVGSSNWKITLDDGEIERFTLNPGDFIFMPIGIKHEVNSETPRMGITFSSNNILVD